MNIDLRAIGGHLAALSKVTMRSFTLTILVTTFAGGALGGLSYYFLRDYHPAFGITAVVLALIEAVAAGVILGVKRAAGSAVAYAFGKLRVGSTLVRVIFERILGVRGPQGDVVVVQNLEQVSPEQADKLVTGAVRSVSAEEQGGWMRRATQGRLLESMRKHIMERIRVEGSGSPGVDLLKLKDKLERSADDMLVKKVRREVRITTALVAACLVALVAVQTSLVILFAQPRA